MVILTGKRRQMWQIYKIINGCGTGRIPSCNTRAWSQSMKLISCNFKREQAILFSLMCYEICLSQHAVMVHINCILKEIMINRMMDYSYMETPSSKAVYTQLPNAMTWMVVGRVGALMSCFPRTYGSHYWKLNAGSLNWPSKTLLNH